LLAVFLLAGAGALGVFPDLSRIYPGHLSQAPGEDHRIAGVAAWVIPAQAQKLFGALADATHSFNIGLVLASFLPLIAVIPLWLFWKDDESRS
jgi:cyanate permease